ncbi:translation initiation factor IF-2 [Candidatus Nitrospira allomarina]|uniref:Translation initiation factor IF-2 n=1 Tax=Candidatus Nitrospira allomarina TaxID=3020900 RepID=A0AA96JZ99_9BACT|nr:translation initiation factor IF-2 [Candidatus Nitrospira allomarina]WNM58424.1 translation initiation factor IF-2 [Candidatus Nitrospira allomarina]
MRVHEIAKKIGMESRLLIPELVRLGIQVSSHSNTVEDNMAKWAMNIILGKIPETTPKPGESSVSGPVGVKSSEGGRLLKKESSTSGRHRSEAVAEEPKKVEKKHILIKKKKTEEEILEEMAELSPVGESEGEESSVIQEESEAPLETGPVLTQGPGLSAVESHQEVPDLSPTESGGLQGVMTPPPVLEEKSVATPPSGKSPEKERKAEGKPDKKAGVISREVPIEEKGKKIKKVARVKDEDLFAARFEDAAVWQDLRPLPTLRREERTRQVQQPSVGEVTKPRKKVMKVTAGISVKDFAEVIGQKPTEIIRKLMDLNIAKTLNQPMDLEAGVLIAESYGLVVEAVAAKGGEALLEEVLEGGEQGNLEPRAPVVTVMGHVDHGKTSLLDAIRQTQVTDQEAGGITQHIGASFVKAGERGVTFLDTPGHEAFTAMRARGAQVTDIVVLVVAADDGPMPQTIEAINHAQAANVPIIVAVNKMDKPGANPDRVKQSLAEHGLQPEAWGGQTIFVEVSAKQNKGLDQLLDMLLLQAEIMELKGDSTCSARGIVLEAKLDKGRGPVATVLIQAGTLRIGDSFVVGSVSGRVRGLTSDKGERLKEAGPSIPIEVIGLLGVPEAGDQLVVVKDERAAREIAQARQQKQKDVGLASTSRRTLEELYAESKDGEIKELPLLVKADVQGSVGALGDALLKISTDAVKLKIIHSGVGGINETDVLLAAASKAIIIGFHVRPDSKAAAIAEREGVEIRLYTIIYNILDDIRSAAEGLLGPNDQGASDGACGGSAIIHCSENGHDCRLLCE